MGHHSVLDKKEQKLLLMSKLNFKIQGLYPAHKVLQNPLRSRMESIRVAKSRNRLAYWVMIN